LKQGGNELSEFINIFFIFASFLFDSSPFKAKKG